MGVPRAVWTLLAATGLVVAVVGWAMLTMFAPAQRVGGSVGSSGAVVTGPGVAALSGGDLTVTASGPGGVFVGVARHEDVEAWLGDAPATRVDGVTATDALTVSDMAGAGAVPDPGGSDIWVDAAAGPGGAELVVPRPPPAWSVAVIGADQAELSWQRPARHPGGWPLLLGGPVLAGVAGRGLVRRNTQLRAARRRVRRPVPLRELVGGHR